MKFGKICNLTSVHPRYDTRIFRKQCFAQKMHYETHLIVADSQKSECKDGIYIHGVKGYKNRFLRMTLAVWNVYQKAKKVDADIYIFHDPELLFVGLLLKTKGKKVYFDAHECYEETLLDSHWIPCFFRRFVVCVYNCIQRYVLPCLDGCLAATKYIEKALKKYCNNTFLLPNYALLREFKAIKQPSIDVAHSVLLIGGITRSHGIIKLIKALELCDNDVRLILCGSFVDKALKKQCIAMDGWNKVDYKKNVSRDQIRKLAKKCFCGIMISQSSVLSLQTSCPNKMFEYISMFLPIVVSNFKDWEQIVNNDGNPFGLLVDFALNPQEIAKAIDKLFNDKNLAKQLGQNGRKAFEEKYNFESYVDNYLKFLNSVNIINKEG